MTKKVDTITYRKEEIKLVGNGYMYGGLLWPNLAGLHNFIDNKLDGTKKGIFVDDYFPKRNPPNIKFNPNEQD